MRFSRRRDLGAAALVAAALVQATPVRVTYTVDAVRSLGGVRVAVAAGEVSGPLGTDLRLSLRTDSVEVEALLSLEPEGDSVALVGEFFTRRRVGRSRRGRELWEQDAYRRVRRLAWGDTARLHPFGAPRPGAAESLWVDLAVWRAATSAATRPTERLAVADTTVGLAVEGVVRPRRARVIVALVRNDAVSAPRGFDLVVAGPARRVDVPLGRVGPRTLALALDRPEPPRSARDRSLATDADVVCLRVTERASALELGVLCGRLNNVARRLPLVGGDTLVATFAWPAPR